jgi:hypothetical protein
MAPFNRRSLVRLAYEAADSGLLSPQLAAGSHRAKGGRRLGSRALPVIDSLKILGEANQARQGWSVEGSR